jgi:hypothetical protein
MSCVSEVYVNLMGRINNCYTAAQQALINVLLPCQIISIARSRCIGV